MPAKKTSTKRRNLFLYKMVAEYAIVFSLILALVFFILYFVMMKGEKQRAKLNYGQMVLQPISQVERFVDEMDSLAYSAMSNKDLIRMFQQLRDENETGVNFFNVNIMKDIDTGSLLSGINRGKNQAWRLSAYNAKGDYISVGSIADKEKVGEALILRKPFDKMQKFRNDFAKGEVSYMLVAPAKDIWANYYKSSYVSLFRPIMNIYSGDVVGVVEVQQNFDMLLNYLQSSAKGDFAVKVYDEAGNLILANGTEDDEVVASAVSQECKWTVQLLVAKDVQAKAQANLAIVLFAAWVGVTLIVILVIGILAARISKPLLQVAKRVGEIDVTNPQKIPLVQTRIDEIKMLQSGFNQVIEELNFSVGQEKKAFLLAMQAQMNPHFLYNVLSVVSAVALEGDTAAVVSICSNLSDMLRYAASYEHGSATISEELEHTKDYLKLMKARYSYMFNYTITVDENLLDMVVPKLIIQPLCENAFTHSFSKIEPPYKLDIFVSYTEKGWRIKVCDNGLGFEETAAKTVMQRANEAGYSEIEKLQIGGLGLISTVVRLKLFTKKLITCNIKNQKPKGAVVAIYVNDEGA